MTAHDTCEAVNCGIAFGLDTLGGSVDGMTLCGEHRARAEVGEGIPLPDGYTGSYDTEDGTVIMPPAWTPGAREDRT